jgi:hypothetical protein
MDSLAVSEAQMEVRPFLEPGERLRWAGRPKRGLVLRAVDFYLVPFNLFWCLGVGYISYVVFASESGWLPRVWMIPFIAIGLYGLIGRYIIEAQIRKRTLYALTDRRVLIRSGFLSSRLNSLPLDSLTSIVMSGGQNDGRGTITFGREYAAFFAVKAMPGAPNIPAFEGIENAARVYSMILDARRSLGLKPSP